MILPYLFSVVLSFFGITACLENIGFAVVMVILGLFEVWVYFLIVKTVCRQIRKYTPSGARWFIGTVSNKVEAYGEHKYMRNNMRNAMHTRKLQRKSRGL